METAFLHGDLTNDSYMDCPEGMEDVDPREDCLQLNKCIYRLVQSTRQFFKITKLGFEASKADPCLLTKRYKKGVIFIALYVDDCLCIGNGAAIKELKEQIPKKGFKIKIDDKLKDYLSCKVHFSKDKQKVILHQAHIF